MKRTWKTIVWLALVLLGVTARAQTKAAETEPRGDVQIWPDTQLTIRLRPSNYSLQLFGTVRIGRNDTTPVSEQAGIALTRTLGKYFTGGAYYRYVDSEPTPARHSVEHRAWLELTARLPLGKGFTLVERQRSEYRNINRRAAFRYRNRLQIEHPLSIGERKLTPYVAGEALFDSRYQQWNRFIYFIGNRTLVNKHLTFDTFYMRLLDTQARPGFLHILGLTTRIEY